MYSLSCVAVKNLGCWTGPVPVGAGGMTHSGLWQHTGIPFCISHWQEKPPAVPWMDTPIFQISDRIKPFSVPGPAVCRGQAWLSREGPSLQPRWLHGHLARPWLWHSVWICGWSWVLLPPPSPPKALKRCPSWQLRGRACRAAPRPGHGHFSGEARRHLALSWDMSVFEDTLASVLEWAPDPCVELGTLSWPLRSVCWGLRVQVPVLPPYRELVDAVPHTVPPRSTGGRCPSTPR